jgi:hypothetical protein
MDGKNMLFADQQFDLTYINFPDPPVEGATDLDMSGFDFMTREAVRCTIAGGRVIIKSENRKITGSLTRKEYSIETVVIQVEHEKMGEQKKVVPDRISWSQKLEDLLDGEIEVCDLSSQDLNCLSKPGAFSQEKSAGALQMLRDNIIDAKGDIEDLLKEHEASRLSRREREALKKRQKIYLKVINRIKKELAGRSVSSPVAAPARTKTSSSPVSLARIVPLVLLSVNTARA